MPAEAVAEYLTPGDAALILGLSAQGVRLAAERGRLKISARTAGGVRLFLRSEVERFKRERSKRAKSA
jgi:DNA-binding transcriptional MerR regulator